MAQARKKAADKVGNGESGDKKRSMQTKVIVGVLLVVILEVVTITTVAILTSEPEAGAGMEGFKLDESRKLDKIREIILIEGRFPNNLRGITYLYDTEIRVEVKQKNAERVESQIAELEGRLMMNISTIMGQAEPRLFEEPHFVTLRRQIEQMLRDVIKPDIETNESLIEGVLIVKLVGFPAG